MKFPESINKWVKKGSELRQRVYQNDIDQTLPKNVAKAIIKIDALPNQLIREGERLGKNLLESYLLLRREYSGENPSKKISDGELKNVPEAIKKMRTLPRYEQDQKLADIKESIAWMKIELGKAEKKIINDLLDKPPNSKEEAFERIVKSLKHIPISFDDYGSILAWSDNFYERCENTFKTRKAYSDREIFKKATGHDPVGDIEVMTSPIGFYIRAHDLEDYTNLYYMNNDAQDLSLGDRKNRMLHADKSGGFKNYTLTAENAQGKEFLGRNRSVYIHETQHAIYGQMKFELGDIWGSGDFSEQVLTLWNQKNLETSEPVTSYLKIKRQFKSILEELYTRRLPWVLEMGKDEVLAYTLDGDYSVEKIYELLTDHFGLYNYYKTHYDFLIENPSIYDYDIVLPLDIQNQVDKEEDFDKSYKIRREYQEGESRKITEWVDSFRDEVGNKVFTIKYQKILWQGLEAMDRLKKSGIDTETCVRILTHEPLEKWGKVVDRILVKEKNIN